MVKYGAVLHRQGVAGEVLYVEACHSVEVCLPLLGALPRDSVDEVNRHVAVATLFQVRHRSHRIFTAVTAVEQTQVGVGERLHTHAHTVEEPHCTQVGHILFGETFGVGFDGAFFNLREVERAVQLFHYALELVDGE